MPALSRWALACLAFPSVQFDLKAAPHECRRYFDATVTPEPTTVTRTHIKIATTTLTSITDASSAIVITDLASATATLTSYYPTTTTTTIVVKRNDASCPAPSPVVHTYPTYASACTDGAAFASACSCLGVTAGTTKTLSPCTSTVHVTTTQTDTVSTAITSTLATTVTETITDATVTSSIIATTTTMDVYSYPPICATANASESNFYYTLYYTGASYSENSDNPGNNDPAYPPITNTLSGGYTPCEAAEQCAEIAADDPLVYYSFELAYLESTGQWQCVQYFDENSDGAEEFNVYNPDIAMAYGFNIVMV